MATESTIPIERAIFWERTMPSARAKLIASITHEERA
jgi:hypothetical protein